MPPPPFPEAESSDVLVFQAGVTDSSSDNWRFTGEYCENVVAGASADYAVNVDHDAHTYLWVCYAAGHARPLSLLINESAVGSVCAESTGSDLDYKWVKFGPFNLQAGRNVVTFQTDGHFPRMSTLALQPFLSDDPREDDNEQDQDQDQDESSMSMENEGGGLGEQQRAPHLLHPPVPEHALSLAVGRPRFRGRRWRTVHHIFLLQIVGEGLAREASMCAAGQDPVPRHQMWSQIGDRMDERFPDAGMNFLPDALKAKYKDICKMCMLQLAAEEQSGQPSMDPEKQVMVAEFLKVRALGDDMQKRARAAPNFAQKRRFDLTPMDPQYKRQAIADSSSAFPDISSPLPSSYSQVHHHQRAPPPVAASTSASASASSSARTDDHWNEFMIEQRKHNIRIEELVLRQVQHAEQTAEQLSYALQEQTAALRACAEATSMATQVLSQMTSSHNENLQQFFSQIVGVLRQQVE